MKRVELPFLFFPFLNVLYPLLLGVRVNKSEFYKVYTHLLLEGVWDEWVNGIVNM